MIKAARLLLLSLVFFVGCGGYFRPLWHDLALPSGTPIKITSLHMVWGIERDVSKDSFALEYVTPDPQADAARRDKEALEVFELIRPASEQFGFRTASVAAFPAVERKGRYRIYNFSRGPEGDSPLYLWKAYETLRKNDRPACSRSPVSGDHSDRSP